MMGTLKRYRKINVYYAYRLYFTYYMFSGIKLLIFNFFKVNFYSKRVSKILCKYLYTAIEISSKRKIKLIY